MKKLLLTSVSVIAFASAAVNANELISSDDHLMLNTMAHNTIDITSIQPVFDLTDIIQNQIDQAFAVNIVTVNQGNLFAKNDKRKTNEVTVLRSE